MSLYYLRENEFKIDRKKKSLKLRKLESVFLFKEFFIFEEVIRSSISRF